MIDEGVETLDVLEHEAVEIGLLLGRHLAAIERLEVELERCQRALQFVGHAVDEVALPLGEGDRLDCQEEVDDDADEEEHEEGDADAEDHPIEGGVPRTEGRGDADEHPAHPEREDRPDEHHPQENRPTDRAAWFHR